MTATSVPENPAELRNQLFRFALVGGFTAGLDAATLWALSALAGVGYLVSAAVGFVLGSTCNYFLSIRYVFVPGRFGQSFEFTAFLITSALGLLLNQGTMWLLVEHAGFNYMLAKVLAMVVVTAWNYLSKKYLIFIR